MKRLYLVLLALFFAGCGGSANQTAGESATPSDTPAPIVQSTPLNDFEEALRFVRNGQFTYIWVFSRKDGKPLDGNDGAFLRTRAKVVVDWASTNDQKRFVAGSNFPFEEQDLAELKKRFVIEDYSNR